MQPLNPSINKSLNASMHEGWTKRMEAPDYNLTPKGRMKLPTIITGLQMSKMFVVVCET
jgi:hypothetical protein